MATLATIMDALAAQLQSQLAGIPELQVDGRLIPSPTTPALDIYPGDPFMEPLAMRKGNNLFFLTVRARVSTADNEAGQDLLLSMMDMTGSTSVAQAILSSKTIGGVVSNVSITEGPSAYGVFQDTGAQDTRNLLGCTWTVRVIP